MRARRGVDSWDAIKWIPRILLFAISLVLILYIFATIITVTYDPNTLMAESFATEIASSQAFENPAYPNRISLEDFTNDSLNTTFKWKSPAQSSNLVTTLVFAPVSARVTLSSLDGSFGQKAVYFQRGTFDALNQLYIQSAHSSVVLAKDTEIVRVIDEKDPDVTMPGLLTIEVLVP